MTSHILDSLDTVTRDHPYASAVLAGDFNQLRDASLLSYPLKQVVRLPTRGSAILDKIYTNLQDWYEKPIILPNIARSDHKAVLMTPTIVTKAERGKDIIMTVRSQDSNGKALLAQAINHTDWTPLYQLQTCDEMMNTFYSTLSALIDHCTADRQAT